ncbi:uncharacterized protein LOC103570555 [Microplitis demolitor]|uniref:uncharacterized protein LOC103570555 n=1 Tax=Microplitis demolitor TaxID=69319 RepID=UPI0004CCCA17|nr:uncharacterized protein LOC103570555 [Microplitis demolitor]
MRVLGLIFDSKMTWKHHIKSLKSECQSKLRILKILTAKRAGANPDTLLKLYKALIRSKIDYASIIYDSVNPTILNSLNTIQNTCLRVCTGAFRTSPISSLQAETGMLPLELRRRELCLKYMVTIATTPDNPAHNSVLKDFLTPLYDNSERLIKPIRIRTREYQSELEIPLPPISTRNLSYFPPWETPIIHCDWQLCEHDKSSTAPVMYQSLFLEMQEKYKDCEEYYTDGSVMNNKTGYAVTSKTSVLSAQRMHGHCSIFTCEISAIICTLTIINNKNYKSTNVIYTDSMSSLKAITNQSNNHPLVYNVHHLLEQITRNNSNVVLVWIPAHQDIRGNELADQAAKEATHTEDISNPKMTHQDAKKYIRSRILDYWNRKWQSLSPTKLHEIRNNIFEKLPNLNRKNYSTLIRLRIGHTNMSHIHLITRENPNECPLCSSALSVNHIFSNCPRFQEERDKYGLISDLRNILNQSQHFSKVFSFIKDTKLSI